MAKKSDQEHSNQDEIDAAAEAEMTERADGASGADEIDNLKSALEEAQQKAGENLDGWQRSQAEFANYRKRIERDRLQLQEEISARILVKYLEVMDDIERAMKNAPAAGEGAQWAEGIGLIYRKLGMILENEGVSVMGADGSMFDPNLHEAIAQEQSTEHESGQIIEVIQPGYKIGERVIRPALVRIAK